MSKINKIFDYIRHVRKKGKTINKSGLYICFSLISIYALIMSIVCFIKLDTTMGIVNAIIGVFMILTIIIFSRIKSDRLLTGFVLGFLYILMMFFLYEGGVGGISIMWLLFVPMGGMALINLYYGGLLSLLIGISTTLYMMTPLHSFGYQYSEEHRIRFPIIYWAFLIMALFIFIRIDRAEEYQKKLVAKADESNRSKSEFLANMSHELRTPMNAIMGMCEINLNEDMNDTVRENNENIFHSSKELMNIINDLLDFSKIGSGKMTLTCNEYHLSKVINDVINMIVARKGKKNIGFAVEVDPDIPDLLYGDEMRIKQIIINILTNALKYTQQGGFIMSVSHRKEAYGINLIITVKDSGIGIKKEQLGHIFDAYGRVDAEKTHKIEGTGLGLPITKKLVRLMNGVIGVKSEYGKGTEFRVVIPQKVIDETPFVTIGRNAGFGILYCCDMTQLHEFIARSVEETFHTIVKRYNFPGSIVDNAADVREKISKGIYSHIFVTKEQYITDKEYFDELSMKYCVTVIRERTDQLSVGGNIINAYKPFYMKKICDIINKPLHNKNVTADKFTAPGARVLIVDDNSLNLRVAVGIMKRYNMNINVSKSGKRALRMMKEKEYDAVFLDHLMPDMDGIETHREICLLEKDKEKKTPVIALTAYDASDVRDLFISENFQDFMSKPIDPELLDKILLKWLPEELIVMEKEQAHEQ